MVARAVTYVLHIDNRFYFILADCEKNRKSHLNNFNLKFDKNTPEIKETNKKKE